MNKKIVIGIGLVMVLVISVTVGKMFMNNTSTNNETKEESIVSSNNARFAVLLEQADGTYVESTDAKFPTTGYEYDNSKSGCVDKDGNKIEGVMSYNKTTGILTLNNDETTNCYIYFKRK